MMKPDHISRYEIKAEIGRGGMATVYRAYDPRFKREVAIKVLPSQFLHDPTFRARFEREAMTIAAIEHPGIVPVHDYGEENGQPYLVMRYMQGGSLSDLLKKGPLSFRKAAHIIAQLAPALDEMHSHGIIHRDLKPGNILFDHYGNACISDFGIARLTEATTTFTGDAIIGTPSYMSPEQARGDKDIDGRSDIYALGTILFEMLTGKQPYQADTPMGIMMKHASEPIPRILEIKPDLPPSTENVITRAMAKKREERFPTARDLAAAQDAIVRQMASRQATETKIERASPSETGMPSPVVEKPQPEIPQTPPVEKPRGEKTLDESAVRPSSAERAAIQPAGGLRRLPCSAYLAAGGGIGLVLCLLLSWGIVFNGPALVAAFLPHETPTRSATPGLTASRRSTATLTTQPALLFTMTLTSTPKPPTSTLTQPGTPEPLASTPTDSPVPTALPPTINQKGAAMLLIPAGPFQMGCDPGNDTYCQQDEKPLHTVTLDTYYIDKFEVTNALYQVCVEAGACRPPAETKSYSHKGYYGTAEFADFPVVYVSWKDADGYCRWRVARLPSEAEWEKAARGDGDTRKYPWGNQAPNCNLAKYSGCGSDTARAGNHPKGASPYGVMDMAGNVWEWVNDWYERTYYQYSPSSNPQGPENGEYRVLRGGSWRYPPLHLRAADRYHDHPGARYNLVGFRCAVTP